MSACWDRLQPTRPGRNTGAPGPHRLTLPEWYRMALTPFEFLWDTGSVKIWSTRTANTFRKVDYSIWSRFVDGRAMQECTSLLTYMVRRELRWLETRILDRYVLTGRDGETVDDYRVARTLPRQVSTLITNTSAHMNSSSGWQISRTRITTTEMSACLRYLTSP